MGKFADRIKINRDPKRIEVPEWGDDAGPLVLYATPMTVREMEALQKKHRDILNNPPVAALVDVIVAKALDADGNKAFDLEDRLRLMQADIRVISQLASSIIDVPVQEDIEGN